MTAIRFVVEPAEGTVVEEVGALDPANPFATPAFFESKKRLGHAAWVLGARDRGGRLVSACGLFVQEGTLERKLELPSLPLLEPGSHFWEALGRFRREKGITRIFLGTFASPPGALIPDLGPRCARRPRLEFVLDLSGESDAPPSSNHRRNLKRSEKAGVTIQRTAAAGAAEVHRALMEASMTRRRTRGEDVGEVRLSREHVAYLQCGAGELFQATREDTTLASVLVLLAPKGGYYQSSGTSPEGMALGASHFLVHGTSRLLRADGVELFNLGGAEEDSGLSRFKEGFGTYRVPLASAVCDVAPRWRRAVRDGIGFLRSMGT